MTEGLSAPVGARPYIADVRFEDVLALHWRVPAESLRPAVPAPLGIDLHDGSAWVSVLTLDMAKVHFRGLPAIPGEATFPEVNLRTYVRHGSRRGVWFLSIEARAHLVVKLARFLFRQPYWEADISYDRGDGEGEIRSVRTSGSRRGAGASFHARFRVGREPPEPVAPGSASEFVSERYWMFERVRRGGLRAIAIDHPRWQVQPVEVDVVRNDLAAVAGLDLADRPDLADWAGCSPTRVHLPERAVS